ncbi:hypothetical protein [Aurantivibrio infirmus]
MFDLKCLNPVKIFAAQWRKALLALVVFNSSMPLVADVDPELLWLPRNYNHHYKTLYRAANTVEQHDRCAQVIAASLSESESDIEHPIFKITCRDDNRISFIAVVDGFTNEILNLPPSPVEAEPEPEAELTPAEIEQQARQAKRDKFWQLCFSQVEKRSRELKSLEWLHKEQPDPAEETESSLLFHVDFNARTDSGEKLEFRAHCDFQGDEKRIEIRARNLMPRVSPEDEHIEIDESSLEGEVVGNSKGAKPVLITEREAKTDLVLDPEPDSEPVLEDAKQ